MGRALSISVHTYPAGLSPAGRFPLKFITPSSRYTGSRRPQMAKHFHVLPAHAIHVQDQRRVMLDAVLSDASGASLMMELQQFIDDAIKNPEHPKDENDPAEYRACTIEMMVFRLAAYGIAAYCLDSQKMQETDDGPT